MKFLPPGLNIDPDLLLTPPKSPDPTLYRSYLHKLPHLTFTVHPCETTSTCTACDSSTPFEQHICVHCGLQLCGVCKYLITDHLIRGDMGRLIQRTARWKLGYSKVFLEREKREGEKQWKEWREWEEREKLVVESRKRAEWEKEMDRGHIDIEGLFDRMLVSFRVRGEVEVEVEEAVEVEVEEEEEESENEG